MKKKPALEKADPQKDIEVKKAIVAHLEEACRLAGSCVSGIHYFEDANVVRVQTADGVSVCIDAANKSDLLLLYYTLSRAEPYLLRPDRKESETLFCQLVHSRIFKKARYYLGLD